MVVFYLQGFLVPHIPYLLPELGGNQLYSYIPSLMKAFYHLREDLVQNIPDVILISSPHFEGESYSIGLKSQYSGSLEMFSRPDLVDTRYGHIQLSHHLQLSGEALGYLAPIENNTYSSSGHLDYGSIVPLRLLDPRKNIPIVPISVSTGNQKEHLIWGYKISEIVQQLTDNVLFIASTELTQDFQQKLNAKPSIFLEQLDREFIDALIHHDKNALLSMPQEYFQGTELDLRSVFH